MSETKRTCVVCGLPDSQHEDGYCPGGARPVPATMSETKTQEQGKPRKYEYTKAGKVRSGIWMRASLRHGDEIVYLTDEAKNMESGMVPFEDYATLTRERDSLREALEKIRKLTGIKCIDLTCSLEAQFDSQSECDMAIIYDACSKALEAKW